ncbi:MAG: RNA pseudouridine synthase, partial [Desulfovibrio sp.]|nr:RNA pseudouridine synthase [Desulfovibrio sp.]
NGMPQARLLGVRGDFCFFAKPAMLHTVRVAGSREPSLEDQIPRLMAEASGGLGKDGGRQPNCPLVRLLQRLDFETSGIVAGALSAEAEASFRKLEREGRVSKRYVCLLEGSLQDEAAVSSRLVSDGRGGVQVRTEDDPDPVRATRLYPLCRIEPSELSASVQGVDALTLAGVVIRRGARHQIRAHAASLGHPLVGDSKYGANGRLVPKAGKNSPRFLLHHGRLSFNSEFVEFEPAWALPAEAKKAVRSWFADEGPSR